MATDVHKHLPTPSFRLIYTAHFLATWGDRMWQFLLPYILSRLFPSTLLPVSLQVFSENVICALFGTVVGSWVGSSSRIHIVRYSLAIQNLSVILSAIILFLLFPYGQNTVQIPPVVAAATLAIDGAHIPSLPLTTIESPWIHWQFVVLFFLLCAINSISSLASVASFLAVERDWVVILTQKDEALLSKINSRMQQIDLFSKVGGPAFLGFVLQVTSLELGLTIISLWNLFSLVPEYLLLHKVFEQNRETLEAPHATETQQPEDNNNSTKTTSETKSKTSVFEDFVRPWIRYFRHPILLASLSYVCLYLTILAPGGHLTAFLASKGMEPAIIGSCYAIAAIVGLVGTTTVPTLIDTFGVHKTALITIWSQWILLVLGTIAFFMDHENGHFYIFVFVAMISFSRFPLWSFDLSQRQIMQLDLNDFERATVTSAETSLTNFATLLVGLLGVIFSDPADFAVLVSVSLSMVFGAALLYSLWFLSNPSPSSLSSKKLQ